MSDKLDWTESPDDKPLGSCPICGSRIWPTDKVDMANTTINWYWCAGCKRHVAEDDIVPF